MIWVPPRATRSYTHFPYTTLFRSEPHQRETANIHRIAGDHRRHWQLQVFGLQRCFEGILCAFTQQPRGSPWRKHEPHQCKQGCAANEEPALLEQFAPGYDGGGRQDQHQRSEEHTSELQSLMRISYAVFCLKKKTKITQQNERQA